VSASDVISQTAGHAASVTPPHPDGRRKRRKRRAVAAGLVFVVAGAGAALWVTDPFGSPKTTQTLGADPTAIATVTERSLSSQTQVNATLGYAGSYNVVVPSAAGSASSGSTQPGSIGQSGADQAAGTFTALPTVGQVVGQGQSLYSTNGSPAVLLYGSTPAYRSLSEGMSGADVAQLNTDLVALGDASTQALDPTSDHFSATTASALEKLQANLGVDQTGRVALGQAVFLPTAARVTSVSANLGAPAQPGATVLQATSTVRAVIVQLDASQQSEVKVGDHVTITLPDNQTTPGVVTSVGTIATTPSSGSSGGSGSSASGSSSSSSGSGSTPTIQVDVTPTDPAATGSLDQAPVNVTITTGTVNNALVVPVDALLAQSSGGYAAEVVGAGGIHRLVPVSLGLFDDADGLVQVTGSGLSAGDRVVVPKL
jgi:hypothetical protein